MKLHARMTEEDVNPELQRPDHWLVDIDEYLAQSFRTIKYEFVIVFQCKR